MSHKVEIESKITDMTILKAALAELKWEYTVSGDEVSIPHLSAYNIVPKVNCKTGSIEVDSDRKKSMEPLKQQYAVQVVLHSAALRGETVESVEVLANQAVRVMVRSHG
jgi:hypothetical protein